MANIFFEMIRDMTEMVQMRSKQIANDLRVIKKQVSPLTEGRLQGEEAALDFFLSMLEADYPSEFYDRYPTFMKAIEKARKEADDDGKS